MATVSTFPLATLLSKGFIPFNPLALKPKKNPKPKTKKSNTMKCNLYEDNSHGYDREWANINDLLPDLLGSNALCSLDLGSLVVVGATSPSGSPHPDIPS
jgi:hypothetical protein